MSVCPVCTEEVAAPHGNKRSPILIILEKPFEEPKKNAWGKTPLSSLSLFRNNLFKYANIDLEDCRIAYLWMHPEAEAQPTKEMNAKQKRELKAQVEERNQQCYGVFTDTIMAEAQGKKLVILVGSVVKALTGYNVNDTNGLVIDDAEYFDGESIVFSLVNPNIVFSKGVGEFRFALSKLKYIAKEIE